MCVGVHYGEVEGLVSIKRSGHSAGSVCVCCNSHCNMGWIKSYPCKPFPGQECTEAG